MEGKLEEPGVYYRILLEWILKKIRVWEDGCWLDGLGHDQVVKLLTGYWHFGLQKQEHLLSNWATVSVAVLHICRVQIRVKDRRQLSSDADRRRPVSCIYN